MMETPLGVWEFRSKSRQNSCRGYMFGLFGQYWFCTSSISLCFSFATRFAQEESNDMMITCVIFTPQLIEAIGFLKTYNFYARRGYYSYIYAKCLAATIWADVCAKDPISLAIGTTLRAKLLQHGGAKEASTLLKDLVGSDDILRYHGKGSVPNLTSLC